MGFIYFSPPSQVALRDSKTSPDLPVGGFPGVWKPSIKTPFPGQISVPSSFVSLFIFYILSYFLSKTMGCLSGRLMTSASDQKLFCEVCSAFNCSFDEFVGEKVVSHPIPPPSWLLPLETTLESPLDSKEIKPVSPKGNQPCIFTGRTHAEAQVPILCPPDAKSRLIGNVSGARKD